MFSFLFGSKEETKEEVKVIPDPDWEIENCDICESISNEAPIERMQRLVQAIKKNLKNEYFREAISQIDELDVMIYNCSANENETVPSEIVEFFESELVRRAKVDCERLDAYLDHIEDFSRDWELYSKHGNTCVYNKPNFEKGDLTSFTFGGESIINAPLLQVATIVSENDLLVNLAPTLEKFDICKEVSPLK